MLRKEQVKIQEIQENEIELLKKALENGILDMSNIQQSVTMKENEKYLGYHEYKIWQGKDGKWRTYLQDNTKAKGRVLKKRTTKEGIEKVIIDYYKQIDSSDKNNKNINGLKLSSELTFGQLYDIWVNYRSENNLVSGSTIIKNNCDYKRFYKNTDFSKMKIKNITDNVIDEFLLDVLKRHKLTSKGFSSAKSVVIGVFKYAKKEHLSTVSVTTAIKDMEVPKSTYKKKKIIKEKEVFLQDEINKMESYLKSNIDIWNLGILLTFQTGLRVGELCTLKWEDVNLDKRTIYVQRTETISMKDGKKVRAVSDSPKTNDSDREVILSDSAIETVKLIWKYRIDNNITSEYLFVGIRGNNRIIGVTFTSRIERICEKLGITSKSMHKVRKTYGTAMIDSKMDEALVAEQMGHKSIETTKQYYYFSNKNDNNKLRQINNASMM